VTISPEGKITGVNEATVKASGVPRDKLVGTDFSDYLTEPELARKGYDQVFSEGCVTDYPLTIRRQDGHLTPVLYNASLYRDARGCLTSAGRRDAVSMDLHPDRRVAKPQPKAASGPEKSAR